MEGSKGAHEIEIDQAHRINWRVVSPEIVEIGSEEYSINTSRSVLVSSREVSDVYVAVGRDDVEVVKWAIDHHVDVSPGASVYLVHVFAPITLIPTPVGRLQRSQLSKEQVRAHVNEENDRRRNLLQKYIRLCNDAKVPVDTILVESKETTKAILDLIPVLNITNLVLGTKRSRSSRRLVMKGARRGEVVRKNAPEYCKVTIVHMGKKLVDSPKVVPAATTLASNQQRPKIDRQVEGNCFFSWVRFPLKSD